MAIRTADLTDQRAFELIFHDLMLQRRTAMPAIIKSLNLDNGKLISVNVQPAINQRIASDDGLSSTSQLMPLINNVPIVMPYSQTKGLGFTVPITVGDECLLVIGDRSIDNWQDKGGTQDPAEPVTPRAHNLTDAFCLVGAFATPNSVSNYDFNNASMRNSDGTTVVKLKDNTIVIKTTDGSTINVAGDTISCTTGTTSVIIEPTKITLSVGAATLTLDGTSLISTVPIQAPGYSGDAGGAAVMDNDLDMNSNAINNASAATVSGVELGAHIHEGDSGGDTGPPEDP